MSEPTPGLNAMFRASELKRREARRRVILNHAALEDEEKSQEEQAALELIRLQSDAFQRIQWGGYWRNLWKAIRGSYDL